ncbi:MAG TPA: carboxypeptidase-like regulatory domain-containing protein, partial [Fluviicola sp.]|nr:carboxypeptidase-like regulatory domain-containing protein [Fluviicola sp.]
MLKLLAILYLCTTSLFVFSQQTKVSGRVVDAANGEGIPDVQIRFLNSKIGTLTDSLGFYILETYYATDSISFFMPEFERVVKFVKKETAQVINVSLKESVVDITEVTILPPDEFPSTTLHKKVIANKKINDKEKLLSYEYELYNKLQVDLNNIGEKFENRKIVKRLDLIMNYLDSVD